MPFSTLESFQGKPLVVPTNKEARLRSWRQPTFPLSDSPSVIIDSGNGVPLRHRESGPPLRNIPQQRGLKVARSGLWPRRSAVCCM